MDELELHYKLSYVITKNIDNITLDKLDKVKNTLEGRDEKKIASVYFHIGNSGVTFSIADHYGPTLEISSSVFGNNVQSQKLSMTKDNFKTLKELFELAEKQDYSEQYCYATDSGEIKTSQDERQSKINQAYYLSTLKNDFSTSLKNYTKQGEFDLEYLSPTKEELEVAKEEYHKRNNYSNSNILGTITTSNENE